jgi:altronate hydrolase
MPIPRANAILLHPDDSVAVAARDLETGTAVAAGGRSVRLAEAVRQGHKVALSPVPAGQPVLKYGQTIGFATADIEPGSWVHVHNLSAEAFERDYAPCSAVPPDPAPITDRTFQGYRRASGQVGTRNYIAVISNVNCSASVAHFAAARFDRGALRDFPNVDGVLPITHGGGCGLQYAGENHKLLNRTLAGIARHPNVGAYVLVGLGCETATLGNLLQQEGLVQLQVGAPPERPPTFSMQDLGGTQNTVDAIARSIGEMLPRVNDVRREAFPASQLVLGTNCGGSDGSSGITANPALGVASDLLVAAGGTSVLAETPEIYGAEQLLTRRARTPQVAQKLIDRIRWWERYAGMYGARLDNNPSPGNKEGGLTTIYEKSLGAVTKGGSTALEAVYEYAEPITAKGLVVMDTPGFDPVSVTGIVAGGANVVVFTTGRGSCFGCQPTPSLKIATNTPMYLRMQADMDLDAGSILAGASVEAIGRQIFEQILAVASGQRTKSELLGVGAAEFVPWNIGPVL